MNVRLQPEVLRWARRRAGLSEADLGRKLGIAKDPADRVTQWERDGVITYKRAESLAQKTHTPFGYLFLPEPPEEKLPVADFRTVGSVGDDAATSPELLDVLFDAMRKQSWYRGYLIELGQERLEFVGAARLSDDPAMVGQEMRRVIGLDEDWANRVPNWTAAVGELRNAIEAAGVVAVINGIVGNQTQRKLDVNEFTGFALSDPYAPLIFVNGSDTQSGQMFTLAHELAHLWLGAVGEGLSGFARLMPGGGEVETFCDRAAAEFLVPAAAMQAAWPSVEGAESPFESLAARFKISPVIIGRRALDLHLVEREEFFSFYEFHTRQERYRRANAASGGDFYHTQNMRVGRRFGKHVVQAAVAGRIGFKQAYDLLGLHGGAFQNYARRLGIPLP